MLHLLEDRFNKILLGVILALLGLIVTLGIAVNYSHPHIQNISYSDQLLTIEFNRPMDRDSVINHLVVEGADEFRAEWVDRTLYVYFRKALPAGTEHKVRFEGEVLDRYGRSLNTSLDFTFKTDDLEIYYIEKGNCGGFACDRLMVSNQNLEGAKELYSGVLLKAFDVKDSLIVILEKRNERESVMLIDRDRKTEERLYDFDKEIASVHFHPTQSKVYFVVRDITRQDELVLPDGSWRVDIFDYGRKLYQKLSLRNTVLDVSDFELSPDGGLALIQDGGTQNYYLFDLNDENNTIPVGRYMSSGGFLTSGEGVVLLKVDSLDFNARPQVVIYKTGTPSDSDDGASDTALITSQESYAIDPQIDEARNLLVYGERVELLDSGRGVFRLVLSDLAGVRLTEIAYPESSVELPKLSSDGRYLVAIAYENSAFTEYFDLIVQKGFPRAIVGRLLIYDLLEKRIVKELPAVGGFELR